LLGSSPRELIDRAAHEAALLRLLVGSPMSGAVDVSVVQQGVQGKAAATSYTLLVGTGGPTGLTTTPTAGNLIIFFAAVNQNSASTINTPSFTNGTAGTWTAIGDDPNSTNVEVKAWWNVIHSDNIVSGAVSITQTVSVSRSAVLGAIEFANADTTSPISVTAVAAHSGGVRSLHPTGTLTGPVTSKDIVVAVQGLKDGDATSAETTTSETPSSGWTFAAATSGSTGAAQTAGTVFTNPLTATTSSVVAACTTTGTHQDASLIFAIKNPAGGSGPPSVPGAISIPNGTLTSSSFIANWGAASAGGSPVNHYNVYLKDVGNGGSFVLQGSTPDAATLTWTFTGLFPAWQYQVAVEAVDNTSAVGPQATASKQTNRGANKTLVWGAGVAPRITRLTGLGGSGTIVVRPGAALVVGVGGVAPRITRLTGQGRSGAPKVIQFVKGLGGVLPRITRLTGQGSSGTPMVRRWRAGARYARSFITATSAASNPPAGTYTGVHFTAAVINIATGSTFVRCSFDGEPSVNGTGLATFTDCFFDYPYDVDGGPLQVNDPASANLTYCTISSFTGAGPVFDTTGTVNLRFVKIRPVAPATPGPPPPQRVVVGAGVAPRITRLTGLGASGTLKAVIPGGVKAVFGAGAAPRITRLTGRDSSGTIRSVTVTQQGLLTPLAVIPPWDPAIDTGDDRDAKAPNWYRNFEQVENADHGMRDSLFAPRVDAGYMDIVWDSTAGTFKSAIPPHATTVAAIPSANVGIFPAGTTFRDPVLSEIFGHDIIYDVGGWAYLRNIKFKGQLKPVTGKLGTLRPRVLILNVEVVNYNVGRRSDNDTYFLAVDRDSGCFLPDGLRMLARNVKLDHSGNGNGNAFQPTNVSGSWLGGHIYHYQQDCITCGKAAADLWFGCILATINPSVRGMIESAPPYGAVKIGVAKTNGNFWLQENVANQQNTAFELRTQQVAGVAQPLTLRTFTVTNEAWYDDGSNGPPSPPDFQGDVLHIQVDLATNTAGTVFSTANDVIAAIRANPTVNARISALLIGADDGTGVLSKAPTPPDRFQIPDNKNHLLPHSDFIQIQVWDQSGFVPRMLPNGTLVPGDEGINFVTDPNYPGRRGSCIYKCCCIEGNHSGIYFQGSDRQGDRTWPSAASKHIVIDRCRIHAYNVFVSDGDSIGCGALYSHGASRDHPSAYHFFDSTDDLGNPSSNTPSPGFPVGPYPTTNPDENTHHINVGNLLATGDPFPIVDTFAGGVTVDLSTPTVVSVAEFVALQHQASLKGDSSSGSDAAVNAGAALLGAVARGGQSTHLTGTPQQLRDQDQRYTVVGATNASPIVIQTSAAHTLVTNDSGVVVAGVVGNTAANGTWTITVVDSTHFSLNGSTGNGAYASGGVVTARIYDRYNGVNRPLLGTRSGNAARSIKEAFTLVDAAGAGTDKLLIASFAEPWKHPSASSPSDPYILADPSHNQAVADAIVDMLLTSAARNGGVKYITHVEHYVEFKGRVDNGLTHATWEADATKNPDTWVPGTDSTYQSFYPWAMTKQYNVIWDTIKGHANPIVNTVKVGGPHYGFGGISNDDTKHSYPLGDGAGIAAWAWDYDAFVYWLKWSHGFDFITLDYSLVNYSNVAESTLAYVTSHAPNWGTLVKQVKALQATYAFPQASGIVAAKRAAPIDAVEWYWDTGIPGGVAGKPTWAEDDQALAEALVIHQLWTSGVRKLSKWAAMGDAGGAGGTMRNIASWYRWVNASTSPGNDATGAISTPNGPGAKYLTYDVAKLFVDAFPSGTQLYAVISDDPDVVCAASASKVLVINPTTTDKSLPVAGHQTTIPAKGAVVVVV
jgi:hypothetical protein